MFVSIIGIIAIIMYIKTEIDDSKKSQMDAEKDRQIAQQQEHIQQRELERKYRKIKEKELQELFPPRKYKDGLGITLQSVQSALQNVAQQNDIPLAFSFDQVTSGLLGGADNCLVLYHPEHPKDYFSIAIRIKYQGKYAFVSADAFGASKLMKAEAIRKRFNVAAKEGIHSYDSYGSAFVGVSMVGAGVLGIRHLVKGKSDKEKMEIEQQWYSIIYDILNEIIS